MDLKPNFGGLEALPVLQQVQYLLVCLMLIGQLLFLFMWALLPWWREWIGRALMIKSFSLGLLLASTIITSMIVLRQGPQHWVDVLGTVLTAFVTVGIWSQVLALGYEMRRGQLEGAES